METQPKLAASNLFATFDELLKALLAEEIESFRSRNQYITSTLQAPAQINFAVA
jgi:hypothetical protein